MICFAVSNCCDGVGVGCQIVKFRGLIVRTLRHGVSSLRKMQIIGPELPKINRCRPAAYQGQDFRSREAPKSCRSRLPGSRLLPVCQVRVVGSFLMVAGKVLPGGFTVVAHSVLSMFRCCVAVAWLLRGLMRCFF